MLGESIVPLTREVDEGGLNPAEEARVKAILAYRASPTTAGRSTFDSLIKRRRARRTATREWGEGKVFSWLTIQRRQYRKGLMSAERLERLRAIDGVIPGMIRAADSERIPMHATK